MQKWIAFSFIAMCLGPGFAAKVRVLIKIHEPPAKYKGFVEIYAHRADKRDFMEFRQISIATQKDLVTSEWRIDLPVGVYDISVHGPLNMMSKQTFASEKTVIKESGDIVRLEFDLRYNEVRLTPLLNGQKLKNAGTSFVMELRQKASKFGGPQYQMFPVLGHGQDPFAMFFFLRGGTYECTLIQVTSTVDRPIVRSHRWHTQLEIPLGKHTIDVPFEESSVTYGVTEEDSNR